MQIEKINPDFDKKARPRVAFPACAGRACAASRKRLLTPQAGRDLLQIDAQKGYSSRMRSGWDSWLSDTGLARKGFVRQPGGRGFKQEQHT